MNCGELARMGAWVASYLGIVSGGQEEWALPAPVIIMDGQGMRLVHGMRHKGLSTASHVYGTQMLSYCVLY